MKNPPNRHGRKLTLSINLGKSVVLGLLCRSLASCGRGRKIVDTSNTVGSAIREPITKIKECFWNEDCREDAGSKAAKSGKERWVDAGTSYLIITVIIIACILSNCSSSVPKCSETQTTDLVKKNR